MYEYKVNFNFSKEANELHKIIVKDSYVKLREIAVDRLNDMYEKWNKEYDAIYGEMNESEYNRFINTRQKVISDEVNRENPIRFVDLESDEQCDIIARSRLDRDLTCYITLVPM